MPSDEPHRQIPVIPERPRVHPISDRITRSYPVGSQNFMRACQCETITLTIATGNPLPANVLANLVTTLASPAGNTLIKVPFERSDERTLTCRFTPKLAGLHSFRVEYSLDRGVTWLRDNVPDTWALVDPPQVDGLCIYTMIPTVSGTLADWVQILKHARDMGFNAVYLLPITTEDTSQSPYSARDLFEVDPAYLIAGSKQDGLTQLEEFIAQAKALKIRLVFDLVLNHVGIHSTMAQRAPDWIVPDQDEPDGLKRARYWTNQGWRTWDDLALINYEHPSDAIRAEIWAYMTEYALFWAKYANDTGGCVRFDNLHSSNPDFIQALTTSLHSTYPEVAVLAEYFTDEGTLLRNGQQWGLNLVLATPWNYKFVPQLRDYLNYIHRVSGHIRYCMPITSQDSGSPAQEFDTADSTVPRYVAAALLGTGCTGMPQGVEFGEKEKINFIGRKPKMPYPAEPKFARFIARVNAILAEYRAFRCGENCLFVDGGHPAILAAFRSDSAPQSRGFLVVCNFDINNSQRISLELGPLLKTDGPYSCQELLTQETRSYPNSLVELALPPCGAVVLKFPRA